jgi:hypothetical protein
MEIACNSAEENWGSNSSKTKDENFGGMSVFSGQSEWSRILMMDFMDVLVERTPM